MRFAVILLALAATSCSNEAVTFYDVKAQTLQFIEWDTAIKLNPSQEAVKKTALEALPAPCCSDNSAYTCCCPCNLSRTVWGLSAYLITERGADAATVRSEVERWYDAVNDGEFPGDSCYTGGCGKAFADGGCGGMRPNHVVWGG